MPVTAKQNRLATWILGCAVGVAGLAGANLITQDEAKVGSVLAQLKFEPVPRKDPKIIGAPPRYVVTKETLDHLEKLMSDKTIVEVQGDGSLRFVK